MAIFHNARQMLADLKVQLLCQTVYRIITSYILLLHIIFKLEKRYDHI